MGDEELDEMVDVLLNELMIVRPAGAGEVDVAGAVACRGGR